MVLLPLVGCGRTSPSPVVPELRDECRLQTDSAGRLDTLTVVLSDSVDVAHLPIPTNDSEQFFFRQTSETLIRVDCKGEMHPGVAVAWTSNEGGRKWTFTLRDSHLPIDSAGAANVASSWKRRGAALDEMGIDSVLALADGRLMVMMQAPHKSPRLFADPALAVYQANGSVPGSPGKLLVVRGHREPGVIEFRIEPNTDPRDALDQGADLLVTRDPALVEYVQSRAGLTTFALPWTRTYLLIETGGRGDRGLQAVNTPPVRESLAQDAVRADARAAEPPFWWRDLAECALELGVTPDSDSSRIVYLRGDGVAQGLAERIVALASAGAGLRAAALNHAEFASALRSGSERAYVVAVPRRTLAPCREIAEWPRVASIIPLIDTRAHAIVRQGAPPLTVDWDGTVRVLEP